MTGRQIKTGDNALPLTAFALAFSPVSPLSVAAFAALKVSFPGACPGKDGSLILTKRQHPRCAYACEAYMEGIHVGFDRRICTDASSKPLPITTYCLRTFHRLGTNPTVKTALHLPWSDFRASFGAEDAGIQEYSKDDKPEITGNRPCQAARIPFMYAPVFSSCCSFVLKVRFRGAKTNYYKKVRGAALAKVNLL